MRRLAIIAYDIVSNRRRRAALAVCRRWRLDGQLSVHECRLTDAEATELYLQLADLIDPLTDRLMLVWSPDDRPCRNLGRAVRVARGFYREVT
jgi:CRISPR-associated protein Cas2